MKKLILATGLSILLIGCQTSETGRKWVRSEAYFGLSKPDGSRVTDEEWESFVTEGITPRFPAELTLLDVAKQWRGTSGQLVREQSKMLVLLYPPGSEANARIDQIRTAYCHRFNQEAVLKVTTRARVTF